MPLSDKNAISRAGASRPWKERLVIVTVLAVAHIQWANKKKCLSNSHSSAWRHFSPPPSILGNGHYVLLSSSKLGRFVKMSEVQFIVTHSHDKRSCHGICFSSHRLTFNHCHSKWNRYNRSAITNRLKMEETFFIKYLRKSLSEFSSKG